MSKWDGRGSPDTRAASSWEQDMELRAAAEAEALSSKGEHFITRQRKARIARQEWLDGKKPYG